ncbi:MAG TPA: hypothetical protein PLV87_08945, partial [Opitutaceae bacterium]|nr:hypothetical protein [Opitutaceae bacterium]
MKYRIGSTRVRSQRLSALALSAVLAAVSHGQTVQQNSARPADPRDEQRVPVEASTRTTGDTVELSPFTVVSNERGYFSSNTMSGTRLNSNIEDLAQSITVMTKEQMTD